VKALLVGVAGAAGALARYGIAAAVGARSFPWATLAINIVGSFALGALLRVAAERGWPETTTVPLAVGFLGAFTTFSTFSNEVHGLLRGERLAAAAVYLTASVLGGVLAAAAGYAAARAVAP
jgi:CrcB protein